MSKYHEIEIRTYDVWGNEEDGWEVNNVFKLDTGGLHIEDSIWMNDEELFNIAKREMGCLDLSFKGVEVEGDGWIVFFSQNGYPLCEVYVVKTIVDMSLTNV